MDKPAILAHSSSVPLCTPVMTMLRFFQLLHRALDLCQLCAFLSQRKMVFITKEICKRDVTNSNTFTL